MHPSTKYLNCVLDNFLFQHVKVPTRFREGQQPSCLDLIFTNEENMVDLDSLNIDSPLGKSDHALFVLTTRVILITMTICMKSFNILEGTMRLLLMT